MSKVIAAVGSTASGASSSSVSGGLLGAATATLLSQASDPIQVNPGPPQRINISEASAKQSILQNQIRKKGIKSTILAGADSEAGVLLGGG